MRGGNTAPSEGPFPDQAQPPHSGGLRRRSGIVPNTAPGTVPGLQRITEEVLRCARDRCRHRDRRAQRPRRLKPPRMPGRPEVERGPAR